MRAIVLESSNIRDAKEFKVCGDAHHHLRVSRCRPGEEILLLLGEGRVAMSELIHVAKNESILKVLSFEQKTRPHDIEVCIGLVKKDAMEEAARLVTELGVKKVTPLLTEYSQRPSNQFKRWSKIVEQAQQQSNNSYKPELEDVVELEDFLERFKTTEMHSYLLSSLPQEVSLIEPSESERSSCLFIGPEGGFSLSEEEAILKSTNASKIHLPTPILRAPTAISVGVGHLLSGLKFV